MKKSAFYKDITSTLKNNFSRFIAITAMAALGIGVFSGFAVGCIDAFKSADQFYDNQNIYDIKIVSTLGMTDDDLSAISSVERVSSVFGSISKEIKVEQVSEDSLLSTLNTLDVNGMNSPYVFKGTLPTKVGQVAVNSKFIEDTGLKLGDRIILEEDDSTELITNKYEITAIILNSLDISNTNEGIASTSFSSSSDYVLYVTADSIKSGIYSTIYVTLDDVLELDSYSDEYQNVVDNVTSTIKSTIQENRQLARYYEVIEEANDKIAEGEVELNDIIAEAEQELSDAQEKINNGWLDFYNGQTEIQKNEMELSKGEQELADAKKITYDKFSAAQKDINRGLKEININEEKLNIQEAEAQNQFATNEQKLDESMNTLNIQRAEVKTQLNNAVDALGAEGTSIWYSEAIKKIWFDMVADGEKAAPYLLAVKQGGTPTNEQINIYQSAMMHLQTNSKAVVAGFHAGGISLSEEQITTISNLAVNEGTLNYSQNQLKESSEILTEQKESAWKEISDARQKIEDGKLELATGQKQLDDNKVKAEARFATEQAKIEEGKEQIAEGKRELEKAKADLIRGQIKLDQNKSEYEESIADARQELADAKDDVANISMTKWYIWDRTDNDSIAGLKNDVSFIQEVTKAFPIIFFLVAILISLTTMTRMVEEDRGLIGTYKSLGYSNFQISMKYIFYAVLACVIGGFVGSVFGFIVLPKVIGVIVHSLYILPTFRLFFHLGYGLAGFGLFLLGITGATAFSCHEMLHQRPAELMRPKAPKAGSRILLERFTFIWRRLNFLNKVTCRNLFRYKKRAVMTIVGILSCTMLIILGFGVKDTVGGLMPDQFDTITVYDAIVSTDDLNAEGMNALAIDWKNSGKVQEELQLQIKSLTLRSNSNSMDIAVMVIPEGADLGRFIRLYDVKSHKSMNLPQSGIVVTQNAAKKLNLARGDKASLQNENNLEHDFPVAFVATNYAGNYVFISENSYQEAFGDYASNSFLVNLMEDDEDGQKWLDNLGDDDNIVNVNSCQTVRDGFDDVNKLVGMIVYLLIGMSAVLAFTVLFTLSNINISERERELATIKVLGFQKEELNSYVNRETFILTLLGIICGLPAGYGITYGILSSVSIAGVAFNVRVSFVSYLLGAVITLLFALLVNKITNKGLQKINMVEALKSVE